MTCCDTLVFLHERLVDLGDGGMRVDADAVDRLDLRVTGRVRVASLDVGFMWVTPTGGVFF